MGTRGRGTDGTTTWREQSAPSGEAVEPHCRLGGGGRVLHGPTEAPGDKWVVQCMDPHGALFAMIGQRKPGPVGFFKRAEEGEASSTRFGG